MYHTPRRGKLEAAATTRKRPKQRIAQTNGELESACAAGFRKLFSCSGGGISHVACQ